jgi:hypothetical protein
VAINCNNGFSGLIKASGDIEEKEISTDPFVKMVTIEPNNYTTIASLYPNIFIYSCAFYMAIVCIQSFLKRNIIKRLKIFPVKAKQ